MGFAFRSSGFGVLAVRVPGLLEKSDPGFPYLSVFWIT